MFNTAFLDLISDSGDKDVLGCLSPPGTERVSFIYGKLIFYFREKKGSSECSSCIWQFLEYMVFPVVMYGYESRTIKKVERQIIDAFELMLDKTLESSLDGKDNKPVNPKGNQS